MGEEHDQPVDADSEASGGRHSLTDYLDKFFVERVRFGVTRFPFFGLLNEERALKLGIVELSVGVAHLAA